MQVEITGEDYTNILVGLERYLKYIEIADDQPDKVEELNRLYDKLYNSTEPVSQITIKRN